MLPIYLFMGVLRKEGNDINHLKIVTHQGDCEPGDFVAVATKVSVWWWWIRLHVDDHGALQYIIYVLQVRLKKVS